MSRYSPLGWHFLAAMRMFELKPLPSPHDHEHRDGDQALCSFIETGLTQTERNPITYSSKSGHHASKVALHSSALEAWPSTTRISQHVALDCLVAPAARNCLAIKDDAIMCKTERLKRSTPKQKKLPPCLRNIILFRI
jgi:hypothetical protein